MTIKKYGKSITSGMFNAGLNFGKGWKGESTRHSLASKGIKTGGIKTKMSTIDSLMFGETMAASSMKAGQELKYAKTSLVKPQIEMDTFGVDSGQVLMTDPAYLKAFMEHYDYDKMIEFMYDENAMKAAGIEVKAESNSKEATKLANERRALYLYKVAEKAFPDAGNNTDKIVTIQDTGGDGGFEVRQVNGQIRIHTWGSSGPKYAKPEIKSQQLRIRMTSPKRYEQFRTKDVGQKGKLQIVVAKDRNTGDWQTQSYRLNLSDYNSKEVAIKDLNSIKGLSKTKHSQALKEINKWFGQLKKSVRVP